MPRVQISVIVAVVIALGIDEGRAIAQSSRYRWVDAAGVVHYSNLPPPASTAPAGTRPAPAPAPLLAPTITEFSPRTIRILTASAEYRMGDRDTREDAVRLATGAAKANALEQVAAYVERVTLISDARVSREQIRTYTAGLTRLLEQKISTRLEGETVVIRADLTVEVDGEDVVRAITALREDERAAAENAGLRAEIDRLQRQLDAAKQVLGDAIARDRAQGAPATAVVPGEPPAVVWIPPPPPPVYVTQPPLPSYAPSPVFVYMPVTQPRFRQVSPPFVRPGPRLPARVPSASGRPSHAFVARSR